MAGGQERILRRRIKSVQSNEEDHARDGAHRCVADREGASRACTPRSRTPTASPKSCATSQAAGAGVEQPVARAARVTGRVGEVVLAADRGLCGALQHERDPRRGSRRARRSRRRVARPRSSPSAASPRATSGSASSDRRLVRRVHAARPTKTRARSRRRSSTGSRSGELDLVQLTYTKFISAGTPGSRDRAAACRSRPPSVDEYGDGDAATRARRAGRGLRVRARNPKRSSTRCCRAYAEARIYAALLNAAASEHAARQRAMKAATDNADELIRA